MHGQGCTSAPSLRDGEDAQVPLEQVGAGSRPAARRPFRTKILTALLSSWLVSPLAIGFAQFAGFANAPTVLIAVMCLGAIAPLQILVNEALAPALVVRGHHVERSVWIPLALLQSATIASIFLYPNTPRVHLADVALAIASGVLASHFSLVAATLQLSAIYAGALRHRVVALIAATPGLIMLAVFGVIGTLRLAGFHSLDRLVYLAVALPAVVQGVLLRVTAPRSTTTPRSSRMPARTVVAFFAAGIAFFASASAATALKAEVAAHHARFAGLLLVALNSTLSLLFTVGKIYYLEGKHSTRARFEHAVPALTVLTVIVMAAVRRGPLGVLTSVVLLMALQYLMAAAVSAVRSLVHRATDAAPGGTSEAR